MTNTVENNMTVLTEREALRQLLERIKTRATITEGDDSLRERAHIFALVNSAIAVLLASPPPSAVEPVASALLEWEKWALSTQIDEQNHDLCAALAEIRPEFDAVVRALLGVLTAVQAYLPPDGISAKDAIAICIAHVDPWPLPAQPPSAVEPVATTNAYQRMFNAACIDLGLINEALGLDPEQGGASPILAAIRDLQSIATQPPPAEVARLTEEETLDLITNWFSDGLDIRHATNLLADFDSAIHAKAAKGGA